MRLKKKQKILMIFLGILLIGMIVVAFVNRRERRDGEMLSLKAPDYIMIHTENNQYKYTKETKEYNEIHEAALRCWENSLNNGKLEFVLLTHLEKEPENTMKVTYYYETPIRWTMYGSEEGREIMVHTYTFFPFDEIYAYRLVVSENEDYMEDAFIVVYNSKELQQVLSKY